MGRKTTKSKPAKPVKPAKNKKVASSNAKMTTPKPVARKVTIARSMAFELQMVTSGCPGDNCSIVKPAPDEEFDPLESFDVWVRDTYTDPIKVVKVWAKVMDAVPSDCAVDEPAFELFTDLGGDPHLWKGSLMAPMDLGDYVIVCWVMIQKIDCKNSVPISVAK